MLGSKKFKCEARALARGPIIHKFSKPMPDKSKLDITSVASEMAVIHPSNSGFITMSDLLTGKAGKGGQSDTLLPN